MIPIEPTTGPHFNKDLKYLRTKLVKSKKRMIKKAKDANIDVIDLSPEAQTLLKNDDGSSI